MAAHTVVRFAAAIASGRALAPCPQRSENGLYDVISALASCRVSIGIKVLGLGAGAEGQQTKESVSRIRFTVMIRHYVG